MTIKKQATKIAKDAKEASYKIANLSSDIKNQILQKVAASIKEKKSEIILANQKDIAFAKENNMDQAKLDRLNLDENKIENLANAVLEIVKLDDPIGKISYDIHRPSGLHIRRISVPIGVILAIYESRPNVTSDIAALGFKSGNAVILRSGKESFNTSTVISNIYRTVLEEFGVDKNCVSYVQGSDRDYVKHLLKLDKFIDIVIPRGGKDLIKAIMKSTKITIFKHLDGNCHTYIESSANLEKSYKNYY
jgi:glutamate-5-semialdehyde dehydrogenase